MARIKKSLSKTGKTWLIAAVFLALSSFLVSSFSTATYKTTPGLSVQHSKVKKDVVSLAYSVTKVAPNDGVMQIVATPELSGRYGSVLGSGSFVQTKLDFVFDAYTGQSFWQRDISTAIDSTYQNPTETGLYIRDAKEIVPGFNISSKQFAASLSKRAPEKSIEERIGLEHEIGVSAVGWKITRSFDTIFTAGLLALLILLGGAVSVLITLSILRGKRPPSMNALSWLAALLFAMFSVRTQLPGSPPNGILFDLWIFYPILLLLVLLVGITVLAWIMRDDWDASNPIGAVSGKRAD
jgi:hypothetical protein